MEQLLDGLKDMGTSKSLQKKINKIPSQQLENMLNKYGGFGSSDTKPATEMTARERLRQKIKQSQEGRMSHYERNLAQKEKMEKERQLQEKNAEPVLTEEEKKQKHKLKMKRLQKKYGTIEDSIYFDALNKIQELKQSSKQDRFEIQKYQNIVDLYHHQTRNREKEKELDLELDDDSNNE